MSAFEARERNNLSGPAERAARFSLLFGRPPLEPEGFSNVGRRRVGALSLHPFLACDYPRLSRFAPHSILNFFACSSHPRGRSCDPSRMDFATDRRRPLARRRVFFDSIWRSGSVRAFFRRPGPGSQLVDEKAPKKAI
jgi:hypothetical protein